MLSLLAWFSKKMLSVRQASLNDFWRHWTFLQLNLVVVEAPKIPSSHNGPVWWLWNQPGLFWVSWLAGMACTRGCHGWVALEQPRNVWGGSVQGEGMGRSLGTRGWVMRQEVAYFCWKNLSLPLAFFRLLDTHHLSTCSSPHIKTLTHIDFCWPAMLRLPAALLNSRSPCSTVAYLP